MDGYGGDFWGGVGGQQQQHYDGADDDRVQDREHRRHKSSKHSRRSRSRSRDRRRTRSRSRDDSGGRRRRRSRSRSRSRSRLRQRRSRSSRRSYSSSRSRSPQDRGGQGAGYRPRRRQAPAKPSASMFAANDPFAHLRSKQALDPAEAMRQWQEQMLKSRQLVLAQQAKSAQQLANKAQRELYIGNLAPGQVTDAMLAQVFNSALVAAFPESGSAGEEPVVRVSIHTDGRYGFVEFRTPRYASAALDLDGQITLMGQALSIGRPASYVDPAKVNEAAAQAEAALAAFKQGLPLPQPPAAAAQPPGSTAAAAPVLPAPGAGAAMAAAATAAAGTHNAAAVAAGVLPASALAAAAAGGGSVALLLPTPFVMLDNMITAAELADDEEYEECHLPVLLDLRDECERFGDVRRVVVPRPPNARASAGQLLGTGNYGKAFVSFRDAVDAAKARERLHGRIFAGRAVAATYVSQAAFDAAAAAGGGGGEAQHTNGVQQHPQEQQQQQPDEQDGGGAEGAETAAAAAEPADAMAAAAGDAQPADEAAAAHGDGSGGGAGVDVAM